MQCQNFTKTLKSHIENPLRGTCRLLKLFPQPIISVYLHNDAKVLHQRRPEESVEELKRQMAIFDKFNYSLRLQTKGREKDLQKVLELISVKLLQDWY